MEKLIRGSDVADSVSAEGKTPFCEFVVIVKKGHAECGDSAFAYTDSDKFIAAVLDGVSGEPGAPMASADAASAILEHLKSVSAPSEPAIKEALTKAHLAIRIGATTATLLHMSKDGSFIVASIGDSPAYGMDEKGKLSLEIPVSRVVKDNDSILKYFYYRNYVTSVLGAQNDLDLRIRSGKLKKGEVLILASDGVSDNLFVKVKKGYVADSSGIDDLGRIIGKLRSPKAINGRLMSVVEARIGGGKIEEPGRMLVPKEDDIAIVAVRRI
jgi:hypothetical protein